MLPDKLIINTLRTNHKNNNTFEKRPFLKKTWYNFDYHNEQLEFDTPMVQVKLVNTLSKAEKVEEIEKTMPTIPLNHFRSFTLNHLKEYKIGSPDTLPEPSSKPTSNLSNSTSQANSASSHLVLPVHLHLHQPNQILQSQHVLLQQHRNFAYLTKNQNLLLLPNE